MTISPYPLNIISVSILKLENEVKHYAWGSSKYIPELLDIANPESQPFAELWMGAHPSAPSRIPSLSTDLLTYIERNHDKVFGNITSASSLPFLFKVLAAGAPLSIQAHPNAQQAQKGFESENRKGIPLTAPDRNYKDRNHKPEVLCALTPFWAMHGFRSVSDISKDLSYCSNSTSSKLLRTIEKDGLQAFFKTLMELENSEFTAFTEALIETTRNSKDPRWGWLQRLYKAYPGDKGTIGPLFLHVQKLEPGEALYVPAGVLHSYLSGMGIELMASSDNVLRGGLTQKHIDIPELLSILKFEESNPSIIQPEKSVDGVFIYKTHAKEFQLSHICYAQASSPQLFDNAGPSILINVGSTVVIENTGISITMKKGESVFIEGKTRNFTVSTARGNDVSLFRGAIPL